MTTDPQPIDVPTATLVDSGVLSLRQLEEIIDRMALPAGAMTWRIGPTILRRMRRRLLPARRQFPASPGRGRAMHRAWRKGPHRWADTCARCLDCNASALYVFDRNGRVRGGAR